MKSALSLRILAILSVISFSCGNNPEKTLILGKWKGVEWLAEDRSSQHDAKSTYFTFNEDGTYIYIYGSYTESGAWYVVNRELYTTPEGGVKMMVKIPSITQDSLVFDMNRGGHSERLVLVRE